MYSYVVTKLIINLVWFEIYNVANVHKDKISSHILNQITIFCSKTCLQNKNQNKLINTQKTSINHRHTDSHIHKPGPQYKYMSWNNRDAIHSDNSDTRASLRRNSVAYGKEHQQDVSVRATVWICRIKVLL